MKVGILAGGFGTRLAEETESLHAFKPQWTARRGVAQRYEAFGTVGLLLEEFEGERVRRIAHVKKLIRDCELDEHLVAFPFCPKQTEPG
ncbi:hypothetical protein BQ8794_50049 [Mesorhizobium prunaredense]|uniref:Uncharacterized protein n=1 Tax=Mesorhizobium prunaredense TaxID=1631249 RepID=A0A1R3VHQ2_9HYPH|nr:hypothetical protein [Mesorhizobium prunaredense]SIT57947.1 hypothetical protein BQ8794_50049 [Mesorhizobium prunaredense]